MTTNRPSCPLCGNNTKKNGTTSKSTTRWRCTHCGHSFTRNTQTHNKNTATMALFIGPNPRRVYFPGVRPYIDQRDAGQHFK